MDLDELLQALTEHAQNILIERHEESLMPMYHIVGDEQLIIGCPWTNEKEKVATLRTIKAEAKKQNATMIGFVCEMWMTVHDTSVDVTKVVPPSQSPDRIEGVLAVATDGTDTKANCWKIVRAEDNTILCLVPQVYPDKIHSGRMVDGLLPVRKKAIN